MTDKQAVEKAIILMCEATSMSMGAIQAALRHIWGIEFGDAYFMVMDMREAGRLHRERDGYRSGKR